jgi:serine/threonine protein kinase
MTDEPSIDDCLDQWEEWLSANPAGTFDEFIKQHGQSWSGTLIQKVRSKVKLLIDVDRHLEPRTDESRDTHRHAGMEPVPGYRLERLLGRGGSGEVWSATGPGGFQVALKFVSTVGPLAAAELRSLELIKKAKHPNLLRVLGTWQVPGCLVISTELADGTLQDRLQQEKEKGNHGIPRADLIRYMEEAAKGIDYLNSGGLPDKQKIIHRDVKPQNLLTMGDGVKVGDFGLVRSLRSAETGHSGHMTSAFAAPEFFRDKTSYRSDQYSLAVTYCYLCTGRLLFEGPYAEMAEGHLRSEPDLEGFTNEEQPVLARALSKEPDHRWPSCEDFVAALKKASADNFMSQVLDGTSGPKAKPQLILSSTPPPQPPRILIIPDDFDMAGKGNTADTSQAADNGSDTWKDRLVRTAEKAVTKILKLIR